MSKRIVTISRQFGSGGHTVGKMVAEKLGVPCYDSELVTKIAEKSGFDVSFIQENGERTSRGTGLFYDMGLHGGTGFTTLSLYDQLYIAQHNIIRELAEKEECVIIGRCADYILKDREDALHVFIHADMEHRAARIVEKYGETRQSPQKRLTDKDNKRRVYYKHYTNRNWGEAQNYHICLNSGLVGVDKCVDIIVDVAKMYK